MGAYFGIVGMVIGVPIFSMIVAMGKEIIDARLKKNELPTDTAAYYTIDSMVDPNEHHEPFGKHVVHTIVQISKRIAAFSVWFAKHVAALSVRIAKATKALWQAMMKKLTDHGAPEAEATVDVKDEAKAEKVEEAEATEPTDNNP